MAKSNIKSKSGFTIIEVVLVLAIAGLIFLMVFVALPALQRNQRDTQRRNDYAMLSTAITNYMTNNGGNLSKLTTGVQELAPGTYINSTGQDPDGNTYTLKAYTWSNYSGSSGSPTPAIQKRTIPAHCSDGSSNESSCTGSKTWIPESTATTEVFVIVGADCSGNDGGKSVPAQSSSSNRAFAIYGALEGGSATYCQDNS